MVSCRNSSHSIVFDIAMACKLLLTTKDQAWRCRRVVLGASAQVKENLVLQSTMANELNEKQVVLLAAPVALYSVIVEMPGEV